MTYDHEAVAAARADDMTWSEIAGRIGADTDNLRRAHWRWQRRRQRDSDEQEYGGRVVQEWIRTPEGTKHIKRPAAPVSEDAADAFWAQAQEDFEAWQPRKKAPGLRMPHGGGLGVLSLYDAHFGMRADALELGGTPSQDLDLISQDWRESVDTLVGLSRIYGLSRWLLPIGHDLSHVNQYAGKMLTTRNGTEQDVDTRLWKIYRAVCRAAIHMIDAARSMEIPVDVVMVPGNHDPDENFKLGEYLRAWYRFDNAVGVMNTPTQNKFYGFGANSFMLTHGEHYMKTKVGNPVVTFANECPPDIWARGHNGGRYILSGHLHARRRGQYTPTSDVSEEGAVVSYVLPGLTATDDWHYRQGYRHSRAGTLQVFHPEGGLLGHHESTPRRSPA